MRQLFSVIPSPPTTTTVDSLSLAAGCGKDHSGELQGALVESITTILYCVGHGIGLVSWNWLSRSGFGDVPEKGGPKIS